MPDPKLSVIIPTRNRPKRLRAAVEALSRQDGFATEDYEVIVVDDGSDPPVELVPPTEGPSLTVERLEGEERSAARNRGAGVASGELLVFVDDDMRVEPRFLSEHWRVHREWPEALQFG